MFDDFLDIPLCVFEAENFEVENRRRFGYHKRYSEGSIIPEPEDISKYHNETWLFDDIPF